MDKLDLSKYRLLDLTMQIQKINLQSNLLYRFKIYQKDKVKFTVKNSFGPFEKGFTYHRNPAILIEELLKWSLRLNELSNG